jgi:spermidine synthase
MQQEVLAFAAAHSGAQGAEEVIERFRRRDPAAADVALARLRLRQGRTEEAASALEAAWMRYRSDPWPSVLAMTASLPMALDVARIDPTTLPRLFAALKEEFSLSMLQEDRLRTRLSLAMGIARGAECVEALSPLEPHVPWDEKTLEFRAQCYGTVGHPLAGRARDEHARFMADAATRFDEGLTGAAPPGAPGP